MGNQSNPRQYQGVVTPVATPLTAEGELDVGSLERLLSRQLEGGVDGIFALGSTGEAIYLTDRQRAQVVEVIAGVVGGSVPLWVGAVEASTGRVIDQIKLFSAYPIDAFVVTAPFYAATEDQEQLEHFRRIQVHSPAPLFAYDIPGNVGRRISAGLIRKLFDEEIVIGLKDSSGDVEGFLTLLAELGPNRKAHLFSGAGDVASTVLDAGADGIVAGIANVCVEDVVAIFHAAQRGASTEAEEHQDIASVFSTIYDIGREFGIGRHASELGAIKMILVRMGIFDGDALSAPLGPYPQPARDRLVTLLDSIGR